MNANNISLSVIEEEDGELFYDFVPMDVLLELYFLYYKYIPEHAGCSFGPEKMDDLINPSKYVLNILSDRPSWFTDKRVNQLTDRLKHYISSIIILNDMPFLGQDYAIIGNNAIIHRVDSCKILGMFDTSKIESLDNSHVFNMFGNSSIFTCSSASIHNMWNNSLISLTRYGSRIVYMGDYSTIYMAQSNTYVEHMDDNSHIGSLSDEASVSLMEKSSCINSATDSTCISLMYDYSSVDSMTNNAIVRFMTDRSKVLSMHHDTVVIRKCKNSKVFTLLDNAKIISDI
jgi:hypothetical protein